jgi:hypothetical protein
MDCKWEGFPPIYRIFLDDELFAERQWMAESHAFVEQTLQIEAPRGKYDFRIELLQPNLAELTTCNYRILSGPARWLKQHKIIIGD